MSKQTMTCGEALVFLAQRGIAWDSVENAIQIAMDAKAFQTSGKGMKKQPHEVKCHAEDPNNCRYHKTGKFAGIKDPDLFNTEKSGVYTTSDIQSFLREQLEGKGFDVKNFTVTNNGKALKATLELNSGNADAALEEVENFVYYIKGATTNAEGVDGQEEMWSPEGSGFVGYFKTPEMEDLTANEAAGTMGLAKANGEPDATENAETLDVPGEKALPNGDLVDDALAALGQWNKGHSDDLGDVADALNNLTGVGDLDAESAQGIDLGELQSNLKKLSDAHENDDEAGKQEAYAAIQAQISEAVGGSAAKSHGENGDNGSFSETDYDVMDIVSDAIEAKGAAYENPEWNQYDDGTLTLSAANWDEDDDDAPCPGEDDLEHALKAAGYKNASVHYNSDDDLWEITPGEKTDVAATGSGASTTDFDKYLPENEADMPTGDVIAETFQNMTEGENLGLDMTGDGTVEEASPGVFTFGVIQTDTSGHFDEKMAKAAAALEKALGSDSWKVTASGDTITCTGIGGEEDASAAQIDTMKKIVEKSIKDEGGDLGSATWQQVGGEYHIYPEDAGSSDCSQIEDALAMAGFKTANVEWDDDHYVVQPYTKVENYKTKQTEASGAGGLDPDGIHCQLDEDEVDALNNLAAWSGVDGTWFSMSYGDNGWCITDTEEGKLIPFKDGLQMVLEATEADDWKKLSPKQKNGINNLLKKLGDKPVTLATFTGGGGDEDSGSSVTTGVAASEVAGLGYAASSKSASKLVSTAKGFIAEAKTFLQEDAEAQEMVGEINEGLELLDGFQSSLANATGKMAKQMFTKNIEDLHAALDAKTKELGEKVEKAKAAETNGAKEALGNAKSEIADILKGQGVDAGNMTVHGLLDVIHSLDGSGKPLCITDLFNKASKGMLTKDQYDTFLKPFNWGKVSDGAVKVQSAYDAAKSGLESALMTGDAADIHEKAQTFAAAKDELKETLTKLMDTAKKVKASLQDHVTSQESGVGMSELNGYKKAFQGQPAGTKIELGNGFLTKQDDGSFTFEAAATKSGEPAVAGASTQTGGASKATGPAYTHATPDIADSAALLDHAKQVAEWADAETDQEAISETKWKASFKLLRAAKNLMKDVTADNLAVFDEAKKKVAKLNGTTVSEKTAPDADQHATAAATNKLSPANAHSWNTFCDYMLSSKGLKAHGLTKDQMKKALSETVSKLNNYNFEGTDGLLTNSGLKIFNAAKENAVSGATETNPETVVSAAPSNPGYQHATATKQEKATAAANFLQKQIDNCKDPAMKAKYEKALAALKAKQGSGPEDNPKKPGGGGGKKSSEKGSSKAATAAAPAAATGSGAGGGVLSANKQKFIDSDTIANHLEEYAEHLGISSVDAQKAIEAAAKEAPEDYFDADGKLQFWKNAPFSELVNKHAAQFKASGKTGSGAFSSADGNHTFDSEAKAAIFDDKMSWFKNQMAKKGLEAKPAQIAQALNDTLGPGDTKVMQGKHYTLNGAIDTKVCDALEQIVKGKPTIGQMFDSSPWGKYGHLKLKALGTGAYEVSSKNGNWDNNAAATAANVAGWFPGYHAAIGPKGSVMLVPQEETSPTTAAAEPATKTSHPNAGALVHFQNSVKKHAGEDGSEAQKLMEAVPGTSKEDAVEALQTAAKQNIELFTHDGDGKVVCSDPAKLQAAAKAQLAGGSGAK